MKTTLKRVALGLASAGLMTIYGCGGGSDEGGSGGGGGGGITEPVAPVAVSISGTAAAGLPLVGNVTVKDAAGVTRTTAIGANGAYALDVTGLTAPFVFRAEGTVGARTYVIHSAASAADANGTINITPLTDLIVANIAGQLAGSYFNSGNFAGLTKSELDAETAGLKAKLLPVLNAMGVESSIDLLRTAFTPLASALDKALDVVRVSIDADTNVATITNLVNQQQITDSLAVKAAAETAAAPLGGTGMASAADDLPLIRKALTDFIALFATGLPSPAAVKAVLHDDPALLPFRDGGQNATAFSNDVATETHLVGASITDIDIRRINYETGDAWPRAIVDFNIRSKDGVVIDHGMNMQIAKDADGVWRLRGNNRLMDIFSHAHIVKQQQSGCVSTGLEFGIEDLGAMNVGSIAYFIVKGPGLPQEGIKYVRPSLGGMWRFLRGGVEQNTPYYVLATDCQNNLSAGLTDAQIAAIPADAPYVLTPYTAANTQYVRGGVAVEYTDRIPGRPLTLAEAKAASFPVIAPSVVTALASYSGGDFTVSASGIQSWGTWLYLGLTDSNGALTSVDGNVQTAAGGLLSTTLTLGAVNNVQRRELRVEADDASWRNMMTVVNIFNSPP